MAKVTNHSMDLVLYIHVQCGKCVGTLSLVSILINAIPHLGTEKMLCETVYRHKLHLQIDTAV